MASQATATQRHPGEETLAGGELQGEQHFRGEGGGPQVRRLPLYQADSAETAHSARAFAKQCLTHWHITDPSYVSDVALVVSELVTNAVRHASGAEELRIVRRGGGITIEVDDSGPGRPVELPQSQVRPHGRGMAIVSALACRWSVQMRESGRKTVRAVLGHAPEGATPAAA
ncbi:ATP-binding protein [Streptomyces sp. ODS28]|uniref:ATP-binding protein n=1 Tax=Streptomyces sp. ODS28 TaxID=3136688 RepID=UPI0031EE84CB